VPSEIWARICVFAAHHCGLAAQAPASPSGQHSRGWTRFPEPLRWELTPAGLRTPHSDTSPTHVAHARRPRTWLGASESAIRHRSPQRIGTEIREAAAAPDCTGAFRSLPLVDRPISTRLPRLSDAIGHAQAERGEARGTSLPDGQDVGRTRHSRSIRDPYPRDMRTTTGSSIAEITCIAADAWSRPLPHGHTPPAVLRVRELLAAVAADRDRSSAAPAVHPAPHSPRDTCTNPATSPPARQTPPPAGVFNAGVIDHHGPRPQHRQGA
jgi:hypothetical protein